MYLNSHMKTCWIISILGVTKGMSDSREPLPLCCMREADFCIGRIMDGSRLCLFFSFLKQKCSPVDFLFLSSSIDRGGAIISSHPPFCAEGEGEVSLFPFSMGLFAFHNGFFSKWKTTHFKILEITFFKKKKKVSTRQNPSNLCSFSLPPPSTPRPSFFVSTSLDSLSWQSFVWGKMAEKKRLVNTLDSKCEIKQEKKSQNVE